MFNTSLSLFEADTTITNKTDTLTAAYSDSNGKKESKIEILDFLPENKEVEETTKSPLFTHIISETTLIPYQVLNTESTTISTSLESTTRKLKIVRKFNR